MDLLEIYHAAAEEFAGGLLKEDGSNGLDVQRLVSRGLWMKLVYSVVWLSNPTDL